MIQVDDDHTTQGVVMYLIYSWHMYQTIYWTQIILQRIRLIQRETDFGLVGSQIKQCIIYTHAKTTHGITFL
jgi:hypothetical protein